MRKIEPKQENVRHWTLFEYSYAMCWWKEKNTGIGHFNQDLYEKFLRVKLQININKIT